HRAPTRRSPGATVNPGGTAIAADRPGRRPCVRGFFVFAQPVRDTDPRTMGSTKQFKEVSGRYDGPALENEVLAFWREHDVFAETVRRTQGRPRFSFNEGPPTANGKPGIHHVLARSFKD